MTTKTTESSIISLIHLNNEGVEYLANGALDKATDTLCQALAQAKELLSLRESMKPSGGSEDRDFSRQRADMSVDLESSASGTTNRANRQPSDASRELVEVKIDFCHHTSPPIWKSCHDGDETDPAGSSSLSVNRSACPFLFYNSFLFGSAYQLDPTCDEMVTASPACSGPASTSSVVMDGRIQIVFTCIFFNLALTHHMWAIVEAMMDGATATAASSSFSYRQCTSPAEYLHSAMKLYELAFSLLMQDNVGTSADTGSIMEEADEPPQCEILALAIINNLGWIHDSLGDATKAARCYEHLLSLLVYLQERTGRAFIDEDETTDGEDHHRSVQSSFQTTCRPFFATVTKILLSAPLSAPAA